MVREDSVGVFGMVTPKSRGGRVGSGVGGGEEAHHIELGVGEDGGPSDAREEVPGGGDVDGAGERGAGIFGVFVAPRGGSGGGLGGGET